MQGRSLCFSGNSLDSKVLGNKGNSWSPAEMGYGVTTGYLAVLSNKAPDG